MRMNWQATIWIGDLDESIDEEFLKNTFLILGEPLCQIKIVRKTGESLHYGFLEFADEETALRVLNRHNGKYIPNSQSKRFKLNRANYGQETSSLTDYSIFVGDLGPQVDDCTLFEAFQRKYKSVKLAKVIRDPSGESKGYGFVKFASKLESEAALIEMQNATIGSKAVRVSTAQTKRQPPVPNSTPTQEEQHWQQQYPGYDYQSYYAAWQNYQQQNSYYNYDQRYANYGYQYPQQYAYPEASQVPSAPQTSPTQTSSTASYAQSAYDSGETVVEEHDVPLDMEQINQELMQRNEELYTALDDSRWLPIDNLDPPLIRFK